MAKGAKKMTNFNIQNYIHLSFANAQKDTRLRSAAEVSPQIIFNQRYKKLEDSFRAKAGVSSDEFIKELNNYGDALEAVASLFNSSTITEIKESMSNESLRQVITGERDLENLIAAGAISGYTTIIGQLYTGKGQTKQQLDSLHEALKPLAQNYKNFLDVLSNEKASNTKRARAAQSILLSEVFKNANKIRTSAKDDTLFESSFEFTDKSYDIINKNIKEIDRIFQEGNIDSAKLSRLIKSTSQIANTSLKGADAGEYSSGILAKYFAAPIVEKFSQGLQTSISHRGRTSSNLSTMEVDITGRVRVKGLASDLENAINPYIQSFMAKDMKADIAITTGADEELLISRKTYNNLSARWVNLADDISIAAIMAFSRDNGQVAKLFNSSASGALFNALNFHLLGGTYKTKMMKNGDIKPVFDHAISSSADSMDAVFGGALSNLMMTLLAAIIEPESVGLMDINGMLIPTPTYYKFMMNKFIQGGGRRQASSYIFFNKSKGQSAITSILNSDKVVVKNEGKGYSYASPSYYRNLEIKKSLLNQRVSVRGTFFNFDEYRQTMLR